MSCSMDVQKSEENESRFLIRDNNKRKLQKIVSIFYATIMMYMGVACIDAFSKFIDYELLCVIYLSISGVFVALPCINVVAEVVAEAWALSTEDLEKSNVLRCVKMVLDLVVIGLITKEWWKKSLLYKRIGPQMTSRIILAVHTILLSQTILSDLESASLTAILSGALMMVATKIIEERKKFKELNSLLRTIIGFISHGVPKSFQKEVSAALESILPVFVIASLAVIVSGILMKLERKCMKNIKLPRKTLLFIYGIILILLALYIANDGKKKSIDIINDLEDSFRRAATQILGKTWV
ncbi:hypothetical protein [Encephalitozoon cuniculi GB-M1]|uniref:Uncharacterized protein n=1 Tax=Encephalitozoon cuniculi (strain GB-M1) TaxID=284813 RepID=Q8SW09_ENCCU|nr:uncharacterized protein ECU03_1320 [Encephalitozoon cuniculi GB-M1]CAD26275.1 hypothetical protein [Encephalitozoon cuniculi GB-M1]